MAIYQLGDKKPVIPASCYIAAEATIIGDVRLGENVSILPGAVLRGDNEPITIGARSNIQEGSVLHTDPGFPLNVGEDCTIGHRAILHGCSIGSCSVSIGLITRRGCGNGFRPTSGSCRITQAGTAM